MICQPLECFLCRMAWEADKDKFTSVTVTCWAVRVSYINATGYPRHRCPQKGLGHNPVLLYPCNSLNPQRGVMHSTAFPSFLLPKSHPLWRRRRRSLLNSDSCHGDSPHWVFILCQRRFCCAQGSCSYADKDWLHKKAGLCLGQVNPGNAIQFIALSLSLHNVIQGRTEEGHAVQGEMQLLNCTVLKEMMFVSFRLVYSG